MSREKDLKRLRKSLYETQEILNDLVQETSADLEEKWGETRHDTRKRLEKAGKRLEKTYGEARTHLDRAVKDTSKELEGRYKDSKKDAEKTIEKSRDRTEKAYNESRHKVEQNYLDARAEAKKRIADLQQNAKMQTNNLKVRAAGLLQGLAGSFIATRNKLEPTNRMALRKEKEKHHLGKGGYFKRFIALAVIIASKKDRMLSLGQELYHKIQDKGAQQAIKEEALGQFDTMRRLIKAYANGQYREFPYTSIIKIVAAVVYFVSVVDLIPDFIPILGLTDDLAVLAWVYSSVKDDLQQFVDWEEANERRREKMEGQKGEAKAGTPVADREASRNIPAPRPTTTPAPKEAANTGTSGSRAAGSAATGSTGGGGSAASAGSSPAEGEVPGADKKTSGDGSSSTSNKGSSGSSPGGGSSSK